MANRNVHQPRANKPLLPATDLRELNLGDDEPGAAGGSSSKSQKRAKVTAVACQPCQKRKSKCDGQRPVCTSCQTKGRTDCVYDSTSDLRRTSALKQRIDLLQKELDDMKDILLSICNAAGTPNLEPTVHMVSQNIQAQDFSRVPELAQVLRSNRGVIAGPGGPGPYQPQIDGFPHGGQPFTRFPQASAPSYGYAPGHPALNQHDGTDPSAESPSEWSGVDGSQGQPDGGPEPQPYPGNYMYQP